MTTQTPVATVWEPPLVDRSLPGGLLLSPDDETPISGTAARSLATGTQSPLSDADQMWFQQPQGHFAARAWITSDENVAGGSGQGTRLVRYEVVPGGIIAVTTAGPSSGDAGFLHGLIARVKDRLRLDWDTVVDLLAMPRRTYFTYRKHAQLPRQRSGDLWSRATLLASAVDHDIDAARVVVATRRSELKQLMDDGRFAEARRLYEAVRRDLASAVADVPAARPLDVVSDHFDALAEVLARPGFTVAARTLLDISHQSSTFSVERLQALIDTQRATRAAQVGGELPEDWEFLPTMRRVEVDEFRARAASFVGSADFTPEAWRSYLSSEAEHAWAAYEPLILPPDEVEPLPAVNEDRRPFAGTGLRSYSQRVER